METIFNEAFEQSIVYRRRDILPRWLMVYMWAVVGFGVCILGYGAWLIISNNPAVYQSDEELSFRVGSVIGALIPGTIMMLMGLLVWLERRRAILFNWIVAIGWIAVVGLLVVMSGVQGLAPGMLIPLFIPYWIGLFMIQRKWRKAVRGPI